MLLNAVVSFNTAADQTVIAAVAGRRIRILAFSLTSAGTTTVTFKRGSTALTGAMSLVAGSQLDRSLQGNSYDFLPIWETDTGEAFVINDSAAIQVSGWVTYDLV